MRKNFVSVFSEDSNSLNETYSMIEGEDIRINAKSRENWLLKEEIFNGTGDVSAADNMYIVQTTKGSAPAMKIVSDNPNLIVRLYTLDMPAGDYVLGVYSLDQSKPSGNYTLMWNCTNPSTAIGHYGRDQSISDVKVCKVNVGTFNTNKYSTNNALFIEAGLDTLWTIMRSQYSNVNGEVTHIMDWNDVTGAKTPRRFTAADMVLGSHYIVVDMNTNHVVDFASPYNYLWVTEEIKGSATFTRTNILGQ